MSTHGFDAKCGELARYFLADENCSPEETADLAQEIQDVIEDWMRSPRAQWHGPAGSA